MKNKDILNLDFDTKIKFWLHYIIGMCYLNAELKVSKKYNCLHKIRNFEDFCNEKDDRVSEGLLGHYYRFNKEIK